MIGPDSNVLAILLMGDVTMRVWRTEPIDRPDIWHAPDAHYVVLHPTFADNIVVSIDARAQHPTEREPWQPFRIYEPSQLAGGVAIHHRGTLTYTPIADDDAWTTVWTAP